MKKYLVDVFLPTLGQHYDAYLPANKTVYETIALLSQIAESLSEGSFKGSNNTMLLDADSGEPYLMTDTIYKAGIRGASRLILI